MPGDGSGRVQSWSCLRCLGVIFPSEAHTSSRRSRAVILHPRRARLTSRLCDDHVREPAEPVCARRKRVTREAVDRMSVQTARNILSALDGEPIRQNVINQDVLG